MSRLPPAAIRRASVESGPAQCVTRNQLPLKLTGATGTLYCLRCALHCDLVVPLESVSATMSEVENTPGNMSSGSSGNGKLRTSEEVGKAGNEEVKDYVARTPFGADSTEVNGEGIDSPGREKGEDEESSEDGDDVSTAGLKRKLAFDEVIFNFLVLLPVLQVNERGQQICS
jgi:hypothetical protein